MTNPSDATKMLTPEGLANQLFDGAFLQNPREAANQVISFLLEALMYALGSAKKDPIVIFTSVLVDVVARTSEDAEARKEVLQHISGLFASAAQHAPVPPPAGTP